MRTGTLTSLQILGSFSSALRISIPCRVVLEWQDSGSFLNAATTAGSRETGEASVESGIRSSGKILASNLPAKIFNGEMADPTLKVGALRTNPQLRNVCERLKTASLTAFGRAQQPVFVPSSQSAVDAHSR